MSSETITTTTAAEEIPDTTTVAPEQETNASGDQDATVIAAVENDAVMEDKPLATPEEIETAKTSGSATVPTDVAAAEEEASKGDEGKPEAESTEKIATVPANGADGDTDQEQKQEGGEGAIIASDADADKKDGNTNDVEADGEPATTNEVVDKQQADLVPSGTESSERATAASEDEPDAKKQKTKDVKLDGAPEAALAAGMESEAPAAIASGA